MLLQRYLLNLIVRSALLNTLLITFGLDVVLTYHGAACSSAPISAPSTRAMPAPMSRSAASPCRWRGSPPLPWRCCLPALLWLLLNRTRLGRAIRATAQNLVAARLYGVDPRQLYAVTFGIGAALAGAAGGLYGVVAQITPYIGASLTAKSFVIAIIGGLDNPFGGRRWAASSSASPKALARSISARPIPMSISFGLLVLILVARPARSLRMRMMRALVGPAARRRRCSAPCRWLGDDVLMQFGINALLLVAVLAQAWNILGGFTGYVSFGNSVFYGLGTYGTAIAMAQFGLPFGVGLDPRRRRSPCSARVLVGIADPALARPLFRHRHARALRRAGGAGRQSRHRRPQYRA